tara:strand:- start:497 stop:1489 length:993 start_codon:yes stop_codon:yes gene_type:complete
MTQKKKLITMSAMNPEDQIINGAEFAPKKDVSYGKPRVNANGGKSIALLGKYNKNLHVSTPLMMTWGVNVNEFEAGKKTYDLSLQFPREQDANYSEQTASFLENLSALESMIKDDAMENSKDWFNKSKTTPEVIDALWSPMLKYPKNPNTDEPDTTRAPTLRVKIEYYDGKFSKDLELYDLEHNLIYPPMNEAGEPDISASPESLIQKTQNVALVLKCGGLWFVGGKFGITWKLMQGVVQPRATLRGKCHIKLNHHEKERMMSQAEEEDEDEHGENVGIEVQDSDEEEEEDVSATAAAEEEEEEQEEVKPEPPKKKKVVRRKKNAVAEET